jgi:hypothetical protein
MAYNGSALGDEAEFGVVNLTYSPELNIDL